MTNEIYALSPLDGRYSKIRDALSPYFSEAALIKARVKVEVSWLKFLISKNIIDPKIIGEGVNLNEARGVIECINNFDERDFYRIKKIEKKTNHDVKAVELFVAEKLDNLGYGNLKSYVHIGCTSEDINNLAYGMTMRDGLNEVWLPAAEELLLKVLGKAVNHADLPMLAHTHGQPATPTTVGKEFLVFAARMKRCMDEVKNVKMLGKFNGATGNYSAMNFAFSKSDWPKLNREFVESLGMTFNPVTTQIESHDYMSSLFDAMKRFNNVVLDLDNDMWMYISMDYLKQIPVAGEVGSSTMPHKVNPINFENSKANLELSNGILSTLSDALQVSRMQRDLSDSSSQRNIGMGFGYSLQAILETQKGLGKIAVNGEKLHEDLENHWEITAEPIQTMLRKYGDPDAYNKLKEMTRGRKTTEEDILNFVGTLEEGYDISPEDIEALRGVSPYNYVGLAGEIVRDHSDLNKI
ncbi:MAG: adenylosuccinate lyase [Christensenellaceae bacterium]|jgi:adenylosuccinate lyase|nr:adenylosuccinate lyase [Christensenellaceae bacterium]